MKLALSRNDLESFAHVELFQTAVWTCVGEPSRPHSNRAKFGIRRVEQKHFEYF